MVVVANSARTGPSNIFIREFRNFGKLPWLTNLPSFGMLAVDAGSLVASMLSIQQNIILTQKTMLSQGYRAMLPTWCYVLYLLIGLVVLAVLCILQSHHP